MSRKSAMGSKLRLAGPKTKKGDPSRQKSMVVNLGKAAIGTDVGPYRLISVLGRGGFGVVFKAQHHKTKMYVAVKRINLMGTTKDDREALQSEIILLKKLTHANIVQYIESIVLQSTLNIVLQYMEGGALNSLIKRQLTSPRESRVAYYIEQVLEGLAYLHENGVIHRDIKGANLLVSANGGLKLADFGVATKMQKASKKASVVGTPYWMAPEIIEMNGTRSPACDIWSVGCTVLEILTGKPPFYDCNPMTAMYQIVRCKHPPFPPTISDKLRDFLLQCFVKDPTGRPSAKKLLEHPWILSAARSSSAAPGGLLTIAGSTGFGGSLLSSSLEEEGAQAVEEKGRPVLKTPQEEDDEEEEKGRPIEEVEDMIKMSHLDDQAVLGNISARFAKDIIYTNVSSILISVNPYKPMPALYSEARFEAYHCNKPETLVSGEPSHLFSLGRRAYIQCLGLDGGPEGPQSQSILIRYGFHYPFELIPSFLRLICSY